MACDPALLLEQAKCIDACIPKGMMPAVNISLLCNIASAGGGSFPTDGLAHYWKLEEDSGSARLDSIGATTLTEQVGTIGRLPGIHNFAANFSDASSYLLSGGPGSFVISAPWSLSLWINIPSFLGGFDVEEVSDGLANPYLILTAGGIIQVFNQIDGLVVSRALGSLNSWHLVVLTILANGTYSLSIDNSAFTVAIAPTLSLPSSYFQIGASDTSGGNVFKGLMDEVAFFSKALSQSEVAEIWNGGTGTFL